MHNMCGRLYHVLILSTSYATKFLCHQSTITRILTQPPLAYLPHPPTHPPPLQSNLGFIFLLANKYSSMQSKLTIPELEQLGVEGLLKGVERWDPNRNIRFSTYVGFWIRTFMLRPIGKYGYLLRGPARIQEVCMETETVANRPPPLCVGVADFREGVVII